MSRFYASIQGSRGEATRQGTPNSGIGGHIRGWHSGIQVVGSKGELSDDIDTFYVYATAGSNAGGPGRFLGALIDGVWKPELQEGGEHDRSQSD